MPFNVNFGKKLTVDIRECPHLLIVGKGNNGAGFAQDIEDDLSSIGKTRYARESFVCVSRCLNGIDKQYKEVIDERYEMLSALNCDNIEQFNKRFRHESLMYEILLVSPTNAKQKNKWLKEVLMKGRSVGVHVIMFADSVKDLAKDADLLNMLPVKVVYKTKTAEESVLLTGDRGAEKLKAEEFMFVELGKKPMIFKMNYKKQKTC